MDERLEAGLTALNAEVTQEEAPPVEVVAPVVEAPPTPPVVDREAAERAVQARFQASQAARVADDRKALDADRKALESERGAIARAQSMERLLKEDPLAFFKAHGLDAKDVLSRVEQNDRLSPVVSARLDPLAKQTEALQARIAQMEQQQATREQTLAQQRYDDGVHEITTLAMQPGFELLNDHVENGLDKDYLHQVAQEVYAKNSRARPADVAQAMNEGLKAEAKRFFERNRAWLGEYIQPVMTVAPATTPKASAAPPKVTITQAVASQTSGLSKELTPDERLERAVAIFTGKPG